jgi:membrane-bound inhibitor of C-type lysozyme
MRSIGFVFAVFGSTALVGCASAGGHHEGHGPAGIPYTCSGGKAARIVYDGGGYYPRATARLDYDGRRIELAAVPPTDGLRYVGDEGGEEAPILVWTARGEEAWLSELAQGQAEEREIAHCTRLRVPAGHGDGDAHGAAEPEHH